MMIEIKIILPTDNNSATETPIFTYKFDNIREAISFLKARLGE